MADTNSEIFEEIDEDALRTRLHQITNLCRNDFSMFLVYVIQKCLLTY